MNGPPLPIDPHRPLPAEAQRLWEVNAAWWQECFTEGADPEYREQIVPLLRQLLAEAAPATVLDIGCGEGQLSRAAASLPGVRYVIGVDPTRSQLEAAVRRKRQGPAPAARPPIETAVAEGDDPVQAERAGVDGAGADGAGADGDRQAATGPAGTGYARASATALPFPDESFDTAFACLVFEHIEGTVQAIAEVGRVVRPGGTFVLFMNHPLLQVPGSGWVDDDILGEQYWRIGPYLTENHSVEEVDKNVWIPFVHRPLSVYVNAMVDAGLYLTKMIEPPPPAGFLDKAEEYRQAAAFPRLLVLRAEKLVPRYQSWVPAASVTQFPEPP
jgi:SAM-dependent methyltransferase